MATNSPTKASDQADATDLKELKEQYDILKTEMKAMTDMLGTTAKDRVEDVKSKAGDVKDDALARMELMGNEARQRIDGYQSEAERAVVANPMMAVAVSAGIGFLIGALTRR